MTRANPNLENEQRLNTRSHSDKQLSLEFQQLAIATVTVSTHKAYTEGNDQTSALSCQN